MKPLSTSAFALFCLSAALVLTSCQKENVDDTENVVPETPTEYSIEGKWLYSQYTPGISSSGISNTMYLFEDGVRYTYYCTSEDPEECAALYASYAAGDGNHIPGTANYTFEDGVLTIELTFGNIAVWPLIFECNGSLINFQNPDYPDQVDWVKLDSDCE